MAKRCILGAVPKDIQRQMFSPRAFGRICRFKESVGIEAKAGVGFPFSLGKACQSSRPSHTPLCGSSLEADGQKSWHQCVENPLDNLSQVC